MPIFQSIHQQLQDALEEQESLKVQIAEYARQVARVEELLAQKVGSLQYHCFSNDVPYNVLESWIKKKPFFLEKYRKFFVFVCVFVPFIQRET